MLNEVKDALFLTIPDYDKAVADLIKEAVAELRIAGVVHYYGSIDFIIDANGALTEVCSITDDNITRYIKTYVRAHFGSPPDYDKLMAALTMQRNTLQHSTGYGRPEVY